MRILLTAVFGAAFGVSAVAQTSTNSVQTHSPDPGTKAPTAAGTMAEPTATIVTSMGDIHCTLYPDKAPETVANFIGLATGKKPWKNPKSGATMRGVPLYNHTTFHRVIPNFMIQGGDPAGNGTGGPGYSFKDEFSDTVTFDQPGRLAMANSGPATNGSQFFITEVPTPHLNGKHTIFGQCGDLDIVQKIARVASDPRNDKPMTPVTISTIKIVDPRHPTSPPHKAAPATTHKSTGTSGTTKTTAPPKQQ